MQERSQANTVHVDILHATAGRAQGNNTVLSAVMRIRFFVRAPVCQQCASLPLRGFRKLAAST
jgi:hypothetical protein